MLSPPPLPFSVILCGGGGGGGGDCFPMDEELPFISSVLFIKLHNAITANGILVGSHRPCNLVYNTQSLIKLIQGVT